MRNKNLEPIRFDGDDLARIESRGPEAPKLSKTEESRAIREQMGIATRYVGARVVFKAVYDLSQKS